jgi:hypothetical protein
MTGGDNLTFREEHDQVCVHCGRQFMLDENERMSLGTHTAQK